MDSGRYCMRTLMCAVIVAAFGGAGFALSGAYRRRARLLKRLNGDIARLEEQVRCGRPLRGVIASIETLAPMAEVIETEGITGAWQQRIRAEDMLSMEAEETELMEHFWQDFGSLDRRYQLDRFAETRTRLQRIAERAEEESLRQSRLFGSLGLLAGIGTVILLW